MNNYPNYPTHRLYFGEVETPYSLAGSDPDSEPQRRSHFENVFGFQISHLKNACSDWWYGTRREIFSRSYQIKPKSDCIYHFPIDMDSNGRPP